MPLSTFPWRTSIHSSKDQVLPPIHLINNLDDTQQCTAITASALSLEPFFDRFVQTERARVVPSISSAAKTPR